ncbi:MAG: hypothetical protein GEU73_02055 [Chloroflexi bacterium]|nr:hypothetical protein [Chloroflexota bacterium]
MRVGTKIDVLALLDQMEEVLASAPGFPVGGRIVVSRDQLLDLIDVIRDEMPDAIVEADRIMRERERIVTEARDEAERVLDRARDHAAYVVSEHTIRKSAELERERIVNHAREEAAELSANADHYAQELFARLEEEALRLAADIRKAAARIP